MTSSEITINLKTLESVPVRGPIDLSNYDKFASLPEEPLGKAWESHKALVFIIRRLGCPVCRTTALLLSSLRPQLDAQGIKLIGVTFQTGEELKSYLESGYLKGDLYLDQNKKSYEAANTKGIFGFFKLLSGFFSGLSPAFKARMGKVTGNNNEVAAVFSTIAGIKDGKVVFEQKYAEDPNIPVLLQALGVEGDDYKAALESVEMNLKANGDELIGPACSLKNRTCG